MTKKIFNSEYEIRLRILLLLKIATVPLSVDKITALDFITVYGEDFDTGGHNIHGNSPYRFAEIANRRKMVNESVRYNVMDGMLDVNITDGYLYSLSERGQEYVDSFGCSYVTGYFENARKAIMKYGELSEASLMKIIQEHCYELLEGRAE